MFATQTSKAKKRKHEDEVHIDLTTSSLPSPTNSNLKIKSESVAADASLDVRPVKIEAAAKPAESRKIDIKEQISTPVKTERIAEHIRVEQDKPAKVLKEASQKWTLEQNEYLYKLYSDGKGGKKGKSTWSTISVDFAKDFPEVVPQRGPDTLRKHWDMHVKNMHTKLTAAETATFQQAVQAVMKMDKMEQISLKFNDMNTGGMKLNKNAVKQIYDKMRQDQTLEVNVKVKKTAKQFPREDDEEEVKQEVLQTEK